MEETRKSANEWNRAIERIYREVAAEVRDLSIDEIISRIAKAQEQYEETRIRIDVLRRVMQEKRSS